MVNLELLLRLEENSPGIFEKVMEDFDIIKEYRNTIDDKGMPVKISWEDSLKKYFIKNKYKSISKENIDLAEVYASKGISQKYFNQAAILRESARRQNIPEHILGKPLKEETILESIERIKNQTLEDLSDVRKIIEELYDKKFTYEWLNKYDPHNGILGLYCSCCGTITAMEYGRNIAFASIIAEDVQSIVVRNPNGEIISKGTIYINKKRGYAVINDFELNEKYRKHEKNTGYYGVEKDSPEEQDRELIYKAFKRGITAFANEYNKQNPENPLKQINVGRGYNRLKRQIERLQLTKELDVPNEYDFNDAEDIQYIIYKLEENEPDFEGGTER